MFAPGRSAKGGRTLVRALLCLSLTGFLSTLQAEDFETLDTGTSLLRIVSSDYQSGIYDSANALATLFNWRHMPHELHSGTPTKRALALSTAGPLASLEDLLDGRAELGIVRADLADRVYQRHDETRFSGRQELRLISTHKPVMMHVVVRNEFAGDSLVDLIGKRVNIGGEDSATVLQITTLLNQFGFEANRIDTIHAPVTEALRRLDNQTVDAVMFFDQVPSKLVDQRLGSGQFRLLGISSSQSMNELQATLTSFRKDTPYFGLAHVSDFYTTTDNATALMAATYLLSRSEVLSESIDSVINLLDVQPSGSADKGDTDSADATQIKNIPKHLSAFRISSNLSPIPLHSGSQLFIDIFTDPQVRQTRGVESDQLPLAAAPDQATHGGKADSTYLRVNAEVDK